MLQGFRLYHAALQPYVAQHCVKPGAVARCYSALAVPCGANESASTSGGVAQLVAVGGRGAAALHMALL